MEHPFRHHLMLMIGAQKKKQKKPSKERNHTITKSQMPTNLKHQYTSHLEHPGANKSWLASPSLKFHFQFVQLTFQQVSYLQKCWSSKPPTRQNVVGFLPFLCKMWWDSSLFPPFILLILSFIPQPDPCRTYHKHGSEKPRIRPSWHDAFKVYGIQDTFFLVGESLLANLSRAWWKFTPFTMEF